MLELAKEYIRIDGSDEDLTIQMLIDTAKQYIKSATNVDFTENNHAYKMVVLLLVVRWYENRGMEQADELDFTLSSMLLQIELEGVKDETN
ncbi:putative phage protein (predicted DNA packaging) [Virgibacillus natechei]|uniref:Phage protein (Predicted DNA packaging) n=1 Tax=Virgibacillus natechei TaxID=1216297 RepID=A0ABS4IAS4_9BACI|nr:head-tail connector protein [Virgibacillus natechei]MBP1967980.1 putative phage protein (predicted DNA packaging) [Virgibacillus natechei]UZD14734.1 head-tail connector protein [Virgibacillus natechei]